MHATHRWTPQTTAIVGGEDTSLGQWPASAGVVIAGNVGIDSCFGDSGGPPYLITDYGTFLASVTSCGINMSGAWLFCALVTLIMMRRRQDYRS